MIFILNYFHNLIWYFDILFESKWTRITPTNSLSSPKLQLGPSGMAADGASGGGDEGHPPPSPFDQPSTSKDFPPKVSILPFDSV